MTDEPRVHVWHFGSEKAARAAYDRATDKLVRLWEEHHAGGVADGLTAATAGPLGDVGMSLAVLEPETRGAVICGIGKVLERDTVPGARYLDPPPPELVEAYRARYEKGQFVAHLAVPDGPGYARTGPHLNLKEARRL